MESSKSPQRKFSGGRASRVEVYGLFLAAIVLIGGGVSGAIAITNTAPNSPISTTPEPSESGSQETENQNTSPQEEGNDGSSGGSDQDASQQGSFSVNTSSTTPQQSCPYTSAQLAYYDSLRAGKQSVVDQAQAHVANVHSWISSNTAHLNELLAAPYRPIEVFQWKPDGSPMSWRVDSNEEIAFERQRIQDNQSELVRAEERLLQAIADRDLIPGC